MRNLAQIETANNVQSELLDQNLSDVANRVGATWAEIPGIPVNTAPQPAPKFIVQKAEEVSLYAHMANRALLRGSGQRSEAAANEQGQFTQPSHEEVPRQAKEYPGNQKDAFLARVGIPNLSEARINTGDTHTDIQPPVESRLDAFTRGVSVCASSLYSLRVRKRIMDT